MTDDRLDPDVRDVFDSERAAAGAPADVKRGSRRVSVGGPGRRVQRNASRGEHTGREWVSRALVSGSWGGHCRCLRGRRRRRCLVGFADQRSRGTHRLCRQKPAIRRLRALDSAAFGGSAHDVSSRPASERGTCTISTVAAAR